MKNTNSSMNPPVAEAAEKEQVGMSERPGPTKILT
jgi:hypothetical protein